MVWAQPYVDSIRVQKLHPHFSDYPAFFKNLEVVYGDHNKAQKALEKLETIQQGKRPAADFIAEFRNLVATAGVSEFVTLYQKLRFATDSVVLDRMEYFDQPKDLEEAYVQITKADDRIREAARNARVFNRTHPTSTNTSSTSTKTPAKTTSETPRSTHTPAPPKNTSTPAPPKSSSPPAPPPLPKGADPNAMEIDAITGRWKLKQAEYQRRRDGNLCLHCAGHGHQRAECPVKSKTVAATSSAPTDDADSVASENFSA